MQVCSFIYYLLICTRITTNDVSVIAVNFVYRACDTVAVSLSAVSSVPKNVVQFPYLFWPLLGEPKVSIHMCV